MWRTFWDYERRINWNDQLSKPIQFQFNFAQTPLTRYQHLQGKRQKALLCRMKHSGSTPGLSHNHTFTLYLWRVNVDNKYSEHERIGHSRGKDSCLVTMEAKLKPLIASWDVRPGMVVWLDCWVIAADGGLGAEGRQDGSDNSILGRDGWRFVSVLSGDSIFTGISTATLSLSSASHVMSGCEQNLEPILWSWKQRMSKGRAHSLCVLSYR